jgi:putative copper export protein
MIGAEAIVSAMSYVALALLLGQLVIAGFLMPSGEPAGLRSSLFAGAGTSLLVFLGTAVLALLIQGAKLQRGVPSAELLWRYVTLAQSGKVWLARELYAVALGIGLRFATRHDANVNPARWFAALALPLVASRSFTSHAVAVREDTAIAVSSDALHLVVSALWAGGLLALWRALRRAALQTPQAVEWTGKFVKRFSCLALSSVTLLVVTGAYQGWIHVGSLTSLVGTDYGRVLLIKLLLFMAMLSAGALNFLSTRRILARAITNRDNAPAAIGKALRRIGIESLIGIMIFGTTGLLTVLPPGVHALHQQAAAAPKVPVGAASEKKYLPAQGAIVKIIEPKNGAIVTADQMPLKFTLRAGKRGDHVHAYIDGERMGMFQSKSGTLNGLKPGRHTLELRVAAADHQSELDAYDQVEFTVK